MSTPRTLHLDADDTLWENNIYYERVTAEFIAALRARSGAAASAHATLWETAQRNIHLTGYGSAAFCQSLPAFAGSFGITDLELPITTWENFIRHHPIELLPGVAATLPAWHRANWLLLLIQGCVAEQLAKFDLSGRTGYLTTPKSFSRKTPPPTTPSSPNTGSHLPPPGWSATPRVSTSTPPRRPVGALCSISTTPSGNTNSGRSPLVPTCFFSLTSATSLTISPESPLWFTTSA